MRDLFRQIIRLTLALGLVVIPARLATAQVAASSPQRWLQETPTRERLSLNGVWTLSGADGALPQRLSVPGAVNSDRKLEYKREFFIDTAMASRDIRLAAAGINYACTILINGEFVAGHAGGYTPFEVSLKPSVLKFGEKNTISIEVDGSLDARRTLPAKHRPRGWPHRSGILRDISLLAVPKICIERVNMQPRFERGLREATLLLDLSIRAESDAKDSLPAQNGMFAGLSIRSLSDSAAGVQQGPKVAFSIAGIHQEVPRIVFPIANPRLWSPETPHLYELTASLFVGDSVIDVVRYRLGLRKIDIVGRTIYLNGKPITIRGVDYVEELNGLSGDSLRLAIDQRLAQIKRLGANAVRGPGHALHPDFVQRCSDEGILVLEEIPLYFANARQLQTPLVVDLATRALAEMIQRDKYEPAVLAWGLGTNLPAAPVANAAVRKLQETAAALDTRPVYLVTRSSSAGAAAAGVDFLLIDLFGKTGLDVDFASFGAKPLLPIFGFYVSPFLLRKRIPDPGKALIEAEEIQANNLKNALVSFEKKWPDYAGSFVHALVDWRSPLPTLNTGPIAKSRLNHAGLISETGKVRIGFQMVAANNRGDMNPPISPGEIQPYHPVVFPLAGVLAIFIFLLFFNRDKRLRTRLKRVFAHPHGFYSELREYRKVPMSLSIFLGIIEGVALAGVIAGAMFAFRQDPVFDEIVSLFSPSANAKIYFSWLLWHPGWLVLSLVAIYFAVSFIASLLIRFLALFFGESLSQNQAITIVFWTAACYLPLALVAPIFYRLALQPEVMKVAVFVGLAFFVWHVFRLYRAIKVLYVVPGSHATLVILVLLALAFGPLALYYQKSQAIFDYWPYYSALIHF